nr:hypothetical protein VDP59_002410 [Xanthomonas campestris pv. campestris]
MALSHFSFRRLAALRNALVPGLLAVSACSAGESAPDASASHIDGIGIGIGACSNARTGFFWRFPQ